MTTKSTGTTVSGALTLSLKNKTSPTKTLLTFHGSLVGEVTVTAKVASGGIFNDVTDGTVDLSVRDYVCIPEIPLDSVHVEYDGAGEISVVALQYSTV